MIEINKVLNTILNESIELPEVLVQGLTNNSLKVKKGYIFFAFKGENNDGNDFIEDAFKNGACLAITDSYEVESQKNVIKVDDVRTAAGIACSNFYNFPQNKVRLIGITGTNGKTSTSTILKSILDAENEKTLQIGTSGIKPSLDMTPGLTTPDIFDLYEILNHAVNEDYKNVILEVSSHALSQRRIENIFFDITAFTNLTLDHLDYHKTMDEYFSEKLKLFNLNKENGSSVLMIDDEYGKRIAELNPHAKCISLETKDTDYFCEIYSINNLGITGTLTWDSKTLDFESKLIGSFNLENLILAASIAIELNISKQYISEGIKNCTKIDGRLHLVENKSNQMIFLDYGHSPDAYLKVLKTLKDNFNHPLKVLFGAGGGRDKSKRPKMAEVVEKYSAECYLAPDNPRFEDIESINDDVINGFSNENYHSFNDRKEALEFALKNLKTDEILIIFGKGTEEYQEINGAKHFYSDCDIIKEFYEN
tara:strand:+ start:618 stop:2057 length:1440 start_codon:yes stop_codon:yes gene_type:complete